MDWGDARKGPAPLEGDNQSAAGPDSIYLPVQPEAKHAKDQDLDKDPGSQLAF